MKKRYRFLICLILWGGLFLLFTGCNSLPPSGEAVPPAELREPVEPALPEPAPMEASPPVAAPEEFSPEEPWPEEPPEFIAPGEEPRERPLGSLPEPFPPSLAEADLPLPSPAEEFSRAALPEPPAWTPPPDSVEEPVGESPPLPPPAPRERASPAPELESPPVPPEPPAFLGSAEEPSPPPELRQRPTLPVNPVPDLPPRSSQELLQSPEEDEVSYSRTVRAVPGQLVEIPFQGTGWVYLGELGARRGIAYGSRRFDPEGQSFIFRAEESGSYSLKFHKQDFIRDSVINDYVRVIVEERAGTGGIGPFNPPVDRGRVIAEPRWPPPPGTAAAAPPDRAVLSVPAPASAGEGSSPAPVPALPAAAGPLAKVPGIGTGGPGTGDGEPGTPPAGGSVPPPLEQSPGAELGPAQYLSRAREEYDAGRVAEALGILDQFREQYPSGSDEAWWLYGQFLEANSPSRDIRSALDYYRRLLREYPQSSRYNEARRRISYLERYYFNIP